MLGTIQFHDKPCLCAVEIHNILSQRALAAKLDIMVPQKAIPQKIFFFGHILAQFLGILFQLFVSFHISDLRKAVPLIRPFGPPSPRGEGI